MAASEAWHRLPLLDARPAGDETDNFERPACLLRFGRRVGGRRIVADKAGGACAGRLVCEVRIAGAAPAAILRVEVRHGVETAFVLDSFVDGVGRIVTAGEMLAAMARLRGAAGLTIDLRHARPALAEEATVVALYILADKRRYPLNPRVDATLRERS